MTARYPVVAPVAIGTVLTVLVVAGLAVWDPGPARFPAMSLRRPVAAYVALGNAAFGNWLELFALAAFIIFACLLTAAIRHARRRVRAELPAASPDGEP